MTHRVCLLVVLLLPLLLAGCVPGTATADDPDTDGDNRARPDPGGTHNDNDNDNDNDNRAVTPPRPPARYLALGDSYTIGEGLTDPAGRWPAQLVAQLRATGERIDDAVVVARTGWTTSDLLAAAPRKADPAYDLVTVMIGVNNQYRGHRTDRFRRELTDLLARAVALAGGNAARLVVTSIPDWGASPFAAGRDRAQVAREIDAYNAVIRDVLAAHAGATYVDVTATSREFAGDRANFTPDGLHYSAVACARYAALVLPACRKVVAGR